MDRTDRVTSTTGLKAHRLSEQHMPRDNRAELTSTTGLINYESIANQSEYIYDSAPPSLSFTHTIEGTSGTKLKHIPRPTTGVINFYESSHDDIDGITMQADERQLDHEESLKNIWEPRDTWNNAWQKRRSSSMQRVDPNLDQSHVVDCHNENYFRETHSSHLRDPLTNRIIIQTTKASRLRQKAKRKNKTKR